MMRSVTTKKARAKLYSNYSLDGDDSFQIYVHHWTQKYVPVSIMHTYNNLDQNLFGDIAAIISTEAARAISE
jgi:hypothetical protein